MNTKQENKFSMLSAVKLVKTTNTAAVDSVPALKTSFIKFDNKYAEIDAVIKLQIKNIKGYTIVKSDLKKSLSDSATNLASALFAFASATNNNLLKESSNFSHSDFSKMRDSILIETAYNIHTLANENITALATYNIDAPFLLSFLSLIQETQNFNPAPTVERSHRKAYTTQLNSLFNEIMCILTDELDKSILLIKKSFPDFYNHYKNARIIIDLHGKSKETKIDEGIGTINITVTAAIDNSLLEDVKADLLANGTIINTTYSDENGEISFDEVNAGIYIIILSQETFNNKQSDEITVQPGDTINLEFALDASLA